MLPTADDIKSDSTEKRDDRSIFWSAEGLAHIARLIEDEIERRGSQKDLASTVGVSATTIKNLRQNKHGIIMTVPDPETLARIAPFIENPETGLGFLSEEFISIGKGAVKPDDSPSVKEYVEQRLDRMQVSIPEISAQLAIPMELLETFLEDHTKLEYADLSRLIIVLGSVLGYPAYLAQLCGIDLGFTSEPSDSMDAE